MLLSLTVRSLLINGVHLGANLKGWSSTTSAVIYGVRNNFTVFDLAQSFFYLRKALLFLESVGRRHGRVLFVLETEHDLHVPDVMSRQADLKTLANFVVGFGRKNLFRTNLLNVRFMRYWVQDWFLFLLKVNKVYRKLMSKGTYKYFLKIPFILFILKRLFFLKGFLSRKQLTNRVFDFFFFKYMKLVKLLWKHLTYFFEKCVNVARFRDRSRVVAKYYGRRNVLFKYNVCLLFKDIAFSARKVLKKKIKKMVRNAQGKKEIVFNKLKENKSFFFRKNFSLLQKEENLVQNAKFLREVKKKKVNAGLRFFSFFKLLRVYIRKQQDKVTHDRVKFLSNKAMAFFISRYFSPIFCEKKKHYRDISVSKKGVKQVKLKRIFFQKIQLKKKNFAEKYVLLNRLMRKRWLKGKLYTDFNPFSMEYRYLLKKRRNKFFNITKQPVEVTRRIFWRRIVKHWGAYRIYHARVRYDQDPEYIFLQSLRNNMLDRSGAFLGFRGLQKKNQGNNFFLLTLFSSFFYFGFNFFHFILTFAATQNKKILAGKKNHLMVNYFPVSFWSRKWLCGSLSNHFVLKKTLKKRLNLDFLRLSYIPEVVVVCSSGRASFIGREAQIIGKAVVGVVDSNQVFYSYNYFVPGNNTSYRSVFFLFKMFFLSFFRGYIASLFSFVGENSSAFLSANLVTGNFRYNKKFYFLKKKAI